MKENQPKAERKKWRIGNGEERNNQSMKYMESM
jgi:hypothetical protein